MMGTIPASRQPKQNLIGVAEDRRIGQLDEQITGVIDRVFPRVCEGILDVVDL
jgi:hypothetical protein